MHDSAKYLIQADIHTSGVVERSDVVGAVFGQTEGLLGDELDLRGLQESSKVGRIDVHVESEGGRSVGTITIASALDKVETAVLAAALETIDRVGPCRAECTVTEIIDARAAKRRQLVDRATELLAEFEDATVTSEKLVEEVRQQTRVEDVTTYEGMPAGPRVADSDAVIVVEGRADVRRLLRYGIKNAVAVEGTDVPEAVAELTRERTVTAFLDGDRGGDLVLEELAQVGDVDSVAFAPAGQSVEDLDRAAITSALHRKIPYDQVAGDRSPREAFDPQGSDDPPAADPPPDGTESGDDSVADGSAAGGDAGGAAGENGEPTVDEGDTPATGDGAGAGEVGTADGGVETGGAAAGEVSQLERATEPETLAGHVGTVIRGESGTARLLDAAFGVVAEADAADAFDAVADAGEPPRWVVLDGEVDQRLLDVAAQRGVEGVVGRRAGEFVKQPTSVRIRTAEDFETDVRE